jgi:hypothetical protein
MGQAGSLLSLLYLIVMIALIVGVDYRFLRGDATRRLVVNVAIVLAFGGVLPGVPLSPVITAAWAPDQPPPVARLGPDSASRARFRRPAVMPASGGARSGPFGPGRS